MIGSVKYKDLRDYNFVIGSYLRANGGCLGFYGRRRTW